jgi:asparagine synthase (glutamine-hydrolysing)
LTFGAGRLSIIDLSAPAGALFNEDHTIGVVFNGEIYNYRELRESLIDAGHRFATHTDTEVIVHGYEQWGAAVIERLRGMFALCLYDSREESLLLARDRMGEKPLYFTKSDGQFLFASEIKAILVHPRVKRAVNTEQLPVYLTLGYVPPPETMFAGIYKLSPGEMLRVDREGRVTRHRYWDPTFDHAERFMGDYPSAVDRTREALTKAVHSRMISDVPVGAFLSGGLDSSAIVALMAQATSHPIQTFTVGFDFGDDQHADQKFNVDARYAELASQHLKTDHHAITIPVTPQLAELLPAFIYHLDEPISQQSIIQTPFVAALARQQGVPVLLSGDAGDELFAGYPHYQADQWVQRYQQIPGLLRHSLLTPLLKTHPRGRKLAEKSELSGTSRYLTWMRMIDPARLPQIMTDTRLAEGALSAVARTVDPLLNTPTTPHFADRIAYTSARLWIAEDSNMRVDKLSMSMSIEARAPLEDHDLVNWAFQLPLEYKLRNGDFKRVFKDAVRDLLPEPILTRPKWGFAPPTSEWLRTVFRPLMDRYLSVEALSETGYFQPNTVQSLIDSHLSKRSYEVWALWPILIFSLWHAVYITEELTPIRVTPADLVTQMQADR